MPRLHLRNKIIFTLHTFFYCLLLTLPATALSVESSLWRNCANDYDIGDTHSSPPQFSERENDTTVITADKTQTTPEKTSIFTGNVVVEKSGLRIRADQITHYAQDQLLKLEDNVQINGDGYTIFASSGEMQTGTQQATLINSSYLLPDAHMRGTSPEISLNVSAESILKNASITSCVPGNNDWQLDTDTLWIDHQDMSASASHVVLRLGSIPVFYTPYIIFPIGDQRRSGLLIPDFGNSDSRGTELSIPFYWNIAPDQDATLTARYMQKRGTQASAQYRYLTHFSKGEIKAELLDRDRVSNDKRYYVRFDNTTTINDHTSLSIAANEISDTDYFTDLDSTIAASSTSHLINQIQLNSNINHWNSSILLQHYDTLDPNITIGDRPYRRLPQINIDYDNKLSALNVLTSLHAEATRFKHEDLSKEEGYRYDLQSAISYPMGSSWWFVTPRFKYWLTQYDVVDNANQPLKIGTRAIPVTSLNAGLNFERQTDNSSFTQTLEPGLFYLHKPFRDQSNIPLFDSSVPDFSYGQLFTDNRFNGKDRVGDANQLTLSLSSHLIDTNSGKEHMSAAIGQVFYFDDQKVGLDNTITTNTRSNIVGKLSANWNHFSSQAELQWNPDRHATDVGTIQSGYAQDNDHIFNASYRFRRDLTGSNNNFEQTLLSTRFAITPQLATVAHWTYSLNDKRDVATLFGLEYDSCCWAARLLVQKHLVDSSGNSPFDTSIMFQFVFKGLGNLANNDVDDTIEHAISGYHSEY